MLSQLPDINRYAHTQCLHPNKMPWEHVRTERELDFLSSVVCGHKDDHTKAVAYIYKELAQLSEIEYHVASVMLRVIGEGARDKDSVLWSDSDLVHALSCFAAEEIQHANTFHQYVRKLSGHDLKLSDNFFKERMSLFEGYESPRVKLAALVATAYVGESVITVFESRMKTIDPGMTSPLTLLLHLHGLDEARHIKSDHFVIDHIVPNLTALETRQMGDIIAKTEQFNMDIGNLYAELVKERLGVDYAQDNDMAATQFEITMGLHNAIIAAGTVRRVDEHLDPATRELIAKFSMSDKVHAAA